MAENLETMLIRIDASTEAVRRELRKLDKGIGDTERKVNRNLQKIDRAFRNAAKGALALAGVYLTGKLASSFSDITKQVQSLDARILQLTGSQQDLAETNEFLGRTADRLGKDVLSLTDGYARLLPLVNGGVLSTEQARQTMLGLSDAASALGAGTAQLGQVMYGLSQALSSPIVRAEEFNQVVEPLPGLMQAMDRAAGLSAGGFRQLVVSGKATSAFFRETFIKALGEFEGAAERLADKNEGMENRLSNAWVRLVRRLEPAAGLLAKALDGVTGAIDGVTSALDRMDAAFSQNGIYDFGSALEENRVRAAELRLEIERLQQVGGRGAIRRTAPLQDQLRALEERDPAIRAAEIEREIASLRERAAGNLRGGPSARSDLNERITSLERELSSLRAGIQPGEALEPVSISAARRAAADLPLPAVTGAIKPGTKPADGAYEFLKTQEEAAKSAKQSIRDMEIDADRAAGRMAEAIIKSAEDQKKALAEIPGFTAEMVEEAEGYIDEMTKKALDDLNDKVNANQEAMESWLRSVSDGFADAILGAESLGDALKGLLLQLARAELSNAIFSSITGKSSGGSIIGGILKNVGLPGFAKGGDTPVNRPFVVGEDGPEVMSFNKSARVTPNMGGVTVNVDARGAGDPAAVRVAARQAVMEAAPAIINAAQGKTISTMRRPRFA